MKKRYLEIGPLPTGRIEGFETLDIVEGPDIDHVCDASKPLPFQDNAFDLIHAGHILEHIPWYMTEDTLREWVRVLKPGGVLEVWVPDGLKIFWVLIEAETGLTKTIPDNWDVFNPRQDPFLWVNGRLMYGAKMDYPSWHRAIFTPRYLKELIERVGLIHVREMGPSEVRSEKHGWVNLGVRGIKGELPKH